MKKLLLSLMLGFLPAMMTHAAIFAPVTKASDLNSDSRIVLVQSTNNTTVYVLKANGSSFNAQSTTYSGSILNFDNNTENLSIDLSQYGSFVFQTVDADGVSNVSRLLGSNGYLGLNGSALASVDGNSGSANHWNIPFSNANLYTGDFSNGSVYFSSVNATVTSYSYIPSEYKQKWRAFYQVRSVSLNPGSGTCNKSCLYGNTSIDLPVCVAPTGKSFIGWSTSSDRANLLPSMTYIPSGDVTLYAIYADAETDGTYMKVTSADELSTGRNKVVLAFQSGQDWYAFSCSEGGWLYTNSISVSNNQIINPGVEKVMIVDGTNSYIYDNSGYYYIKQNGSYFSGADTYNSSTCWKWSIPCIGVGSIISSPTSNDREYRVWGIEDNRPQNVLTGNSNFNKAQNFCTFKKASSVSFNVGQGTCDDTSTKLCISLTLPNATASQAGYSFVGWNDGIKTYAAGEMYVPFRDVTLNAVYAPLKVVYYPGIQGTCEQSEYVGAKVTFPTCTPNEGYRFVGWATTEGSSVPKYYAGQTISLTKALNLYAVYTSSATFAPITSLADLEDGDIVVIAARSGLDTNICKVAEFGKNGSAYALLTSTEYAENGILVPQRSTMLLHVEKTGSSYNFYQLASDNVKYYLQPNESSFWQSGSSSNSWTLEWLSSGNVKMTKTGATSNFLSWVDNYLVKSNNFIDQIASTCEFTWNTGAMTIFKANRYYTLSLNANGGVCDETVFLNGTSSLPTASKTGYLFGGWTDGVSYYDEGDPFPASGNLTKDITLRAVFASASQQEDVLAPVNDISSLTSGENIYILMEDGNGGSAKYPLCHYENYYVYLEKNNLTTPSTQDQYIWKYGSDEYGTYIYYDYVNGSSMYSYHLYTSSAPKTGYKAVGVAGSQLPINIQHLSNNRYNIKLKHHTYQKYQGYVYQNNDYYLSYNTAYGTPEGELYAENICTRSNFVNQWSEQKNLADYTYNTSTSTYTPSVWGIYKKGQQFTCSLTFVTSKGDLSTSGTGWTANVWNGAGACTLPTITNVPAGYNFVGWTSNEIDIITSPTFTPRENLTFTAVFELIDYTYTFTTDNTMSETVDDLTGTVESPITMPDVTMTNDNYTFQGWSATQGGEVAYVAGAQATPSANQTWYAKYAAKEYTITFNAGEGTCSTPSAVGSAETQVTFPTPTAPAGYDFVNWKNVADASDVKAAGAQIYPTADATYNAVYTKKTAIEISQDADPTAMLAALEGDVVSVSLVDRTLQADIWNTFCLPFALASLEGTPLAGAQVAEYVQASKSGDEVTLGFNYTTSMEAGVPYLVKPTSAIEHPTFTEVTIAESEGQEVEFEPVTFIATLKPMGNSELAPGDKNILFLNASAELFYADTNDESSLPGLRAYFQIASSGQSPVRISFGSISGMDKVNADKVECQKIVMDGKLYIIRNGIMYDAQGAIVE